MLDHIPSAAAICMRGGKGSCDRTGGLLDFQSKVVAHILTGSGNGTGAAQSDIDPAELLLDMGFTPQTLDEGRLVIRIPKEVAGDVLAALHWSGAFATEGNTSAVLRSQAQNAGLEHTEIAALH